MEIQTLFRQIPQVDVLLRTPDFVELERTYGRIAVRDAARELLETLRGEIRTGETKEIPAQAVLAQRVVAWLRRPVGPRRVLNATGVALHTNLGRAPLAESALDAVRAAAGYCDLEYDLAAGERGSRAAFYEPMLCKLCGCAAALAVNNNAAALLLVLSALAKGKEILLSRGEMVEIGDGFRVPDIMAESGGKLVEVGTTNRTHLTDYEAAITENTALLLKVHTSNYRITGFTESVSVKELAELGQRYHLPVVVDLGSGALLEAQEYPFSDEPTVPQTLRDGADVICFSGDKLLGGPQAGILCGRAEPLAQIRRSPLARALRLDKLSLAALCATLALYRDPARAKAEIPALAALCADPETLWEKAERLYELLDGAACERQVLPCTHPVGGGCAPEVQLAGYCVAVRPVHHTAQALAERLRRADPPVLARVAREGLLLDPAAIAPQELPQLAQVVMACLGEVTA